MRAARSTRRFAASSGPTIVCAQAGEVNTGAFDPLEEIAALCAGAGAWLHVDGAFGLWAAASPTLASPDVGRRAGGLLGDGRAQVAQRPVRQRACVRRASRRPPRRDAAHRGVPRRGRGSPRPDGLDARVLAAGTRVRRLRGAALTRPVGRRRAGRALVCSSPPVRGRRSCELDGCEVLNEVVLNQVLFRFADDETTNAVLAAVQASGEAWMSGTSWDGALGDPAVGVELADERARHRARARRLRGRARRRSEWHA